LRIEVARAQSAHCGQVVIFQRVAATDQRIQRHAQRVDVAACIGQPALNRRFGSVTEGAATRSVAHNARRKIARFAALCGDAEVEQHGIVGIGAQADVGRLDVAVHLARASG
jgi:hypothetical protein